MAEKGKVLAALVAIIWAASAIVPALGADPVQQGTIAYLSGGVGEGERQNIESQAKNFNLLITNANRMGQLSVDSSFVIKNKKGSEVIRVDNAGPLFYIKLPPALYTITATSADQTQTKTVRISTGETKRLLLTWQED